MSIDIRLELGEDSATTRLQAILDRLEDPGPLLRAVGERLVLSTSDNFRQQRAPDGTAWVPLSPATIRARTRRGKVPIAILRQDGRLAGSISHEVEGPVLRVGSPIVYAAIHQLGGTIRKEASSRWMAGRRFARRDKNPEGSEKAIAAHTITIPARPFLGVSAEDEVAISEQAVDHLTL